MAKTNKNGSRRPRQQQQQQKPFPQNNKASSQMKKSKTKDSRKRRSNGDDDDSTKDWITALAQQQAAASPVASSTTKEERKRKRLEKKNRREDRKLHVKQKLEEQRIRKELRRDNHRTKGLNGSTRNNNATNESLEPQQGDSKRRKGLMTRKSQSCLVRLSEMLQHCSEDTTSARQRSTPFQPVDNKKGKAVANQTLDSQRVQPRSRDYGGLGLARPSLYIGLRDPSFLPLLEEEFAEHVQGFFGKVRTKAMKKQLDGNMLWRRMLADKQENSKKKNKGARPEKRVETMMQEGLM